MKTKYFLPVILCLVIAGCNTSKKVVTEKNDLKKDTLAPEIVQQRDSVIHFELVTKTTNVPFFKPDINKREFVITDNYGNEVAMEKRDSVSRITFKDGHTIITEPKPYTLISDDKKTIIKYGDETCMGYCFTDYLLFYNDKGELLQRYDTINPLLRKQINDKGYIVTSQNNNNRSIITFYSPNGEILWKKVLNEFQITQDVCVSSDEIVVVSYNNISNSNTDNAAVMMIIDKTGKEEKLKYTTASNIKIVEDYLYFSTNESDYFLNLENIDNIFKIECSPNLSIYNPILFYNNKNLLIIASRRDISNFENKCTYILSFFDLNKKTCTKKYEFPDSEISRIQGLIKQTSNSFIFKINEIIYEFNIY